MSGCGRWWSSCHTYRMSGWEQQQQQHHQPSFCRAMKCFALPCLRLFLLDMVYSPARRHGCEVRTTQARTQNGLVTPIICLAIDSRQPHVKCVVSFAS